MLPGRWPNADNEVPECSLFSCEFKDDTSEYTDEQKKIVDIYEVI